MSFDWREAPEAEYAVIGDPVGHSLSPRMHMAAFKERGLAHRYVAIKVPKLELPEAVARLAMRGYQGLNVTVPLKEGIIGLLEAFDEPVRRIGAANTLDLTRMAATNTDAPGFLETIEPLGLPSDAPVLVLGAGGSAKAVVYALLQKEYSVLIHNRTREKALALAEETGAEMVDAIDLGQARLIVNATSASLSGHDLGLDWQYAHPDAVAYDLSYASGPTPFIREARRAGLRTLDGLRLLVAQGALSFEWWFGVPAPRCAMMSAVGL